MTNVLGWNVRGLNMLRKQPEVFHFISQNNVCLFGLLETKVKRQNLGSLYQNVCPGWSLSHNLSYHTGGRILIGWKHEELTVNIVYCSSQIMHLKVLPRAGSLFLCSFVYGATDIHV